MCRLYGNLSTSIAESLIIEGETYREGRSTDLNHFLMTDRNEFPISVDPRIRVWRLLLSIIDFVLSFVVISFIGFVLTLFPHLNRTGRPCKRRR